MLNIEWWFSFEVNKIKYGILVSTYPSYFSFYFYYKRYVYFTDTGRSVQFYPFSIHN